MSFSIPDKAPSEATFRGTEFLSYDLGQTGGEPIVSAQDAITLYFRTRQPNGLLFYTGKWKAAGWGIVARRENCGGICRRRRKQRCHVFGELKSWGS